MFNVFILAIVESKKCVPLLLNSKMSPVFPIIGRIGDIRQWREYIFLELMKNEISLNISPYKFFFLSQVEVASLNILFNVNFNQSFFLYYPQKFFTNRT